MPAFLDPCSLDSTYTIFNRHLTIRETEPELTAPGSQKAILYFLTIHTAPRYHLNSSSQVVLMPPHMVKGRVQPIS